MSFLAVHFPYSCTATSARTLLVCLKSVPQVRAAVSGAAGHNRGVVVETPLLARTQGGNIGGARRRCFWLQGVFEASWVG